MFNTPYPFKFVSPDKLDESPNDDLISRDILSFKDKSNRRYIAYIAIQV